MNITSFLFDKTLPFFRKKRKKTLDLMLLNIFQVYIQRYGISKHISYKLNKYTSIHPNFKFNSILENDLLSEIKFLFNKFEELMDEFLEMHMKKHLQHHLDLYNYKGLMYTKKLPINGQRRRSSKRTTRRVRPIITK